MFAKNKFLGYAAARPKRGLFFLHMRNMLTLLREHILLQDVEQAKHLASVIFPRFRDMPELFYRTANEVVVSQNTLQGHRRALNFFREFGELGPDWVLCPLFCASLLLLFFGSLVLTPSLPFCLPLHESLQTVESILDMAMYTVNKGLFTDAYQSLSSYVHSEPYSANHMVHGYSGMLAYVLYRMELMGESNAPTEDPTLLAAAQENGTEQSEENAKKEEEGEEEEEEEEEAEEEEQQTGSKRKRGKEKSNDTATSTKRRRVSSVIRNTERSVLGDEDWQEFGFPSFKAYRLFQDAKRLLTAAIAIKSEPAYVYYLTSILLSDNDTEACRTLLEQHCKQNSNDPSAFCYLAMFLREFCASDVVAVSECLTRLLVLDPFSDVAFNTFLEIYLQGLLPSDNMIELVANRIEYRPDDWRLWHYLYKATSELSSQHLGDLNEEEEEEAEEENEEKSKLRQAKDEERQQKIEAVAASLDAFWSTRRHWWSTLFFSRFSREDLRDVQEKKLLLFKAVCSCFIINEKNHYISAVANYLEDIGFEHELMDVLFSLREQYQPSGRSA
ncbi:hypothetical protein QOT17_002429 [Balamuthia mandrillaris]